MSIVATACAAEPTLGPDLTAVPPTASLAAAATRAPTPTRTLGPTRVPTKTSTLTPSATPVVTAELPPQPAFDLPDGLTLEEWELQARFLPPDPFVPVAASMESVLERHGVQRALVWPGFVDYDASEGGQLVASTVDTIVVAQVDVVMTEAGYKEQLTVRVDDRVVLQNPPETRGVGMLGRLMLHDEHWYLEVTHAHLVLGTEIELISDVIRDGQSLSQLLGYDEVFGFHLIADAPFFFYRLGDKHGLWYDGVAVPIDYSGITHNVCCAGGPTNPLMSQDMVAFFAQRGAIWYYVEVGAFKPSDATPTPLPDPTGMARVYPAPAPPAERSSLPTGQLCPNLTGVFWSTSLDRQTAMSVIERFLSADVMVAKSAADPAFWPRLEAREQSVSGVVAERFSDPRQSGEGAFAGQLRSACPHGTIDVSWRVTICPDACTVTDLNTPGSLPEIYLLNRDGHWLVWAASP